MENCFFIVDKISKNKSKDKISLTYDQRPLEKKLISDNGTEFLVNLPKTKSLNENQAFKLQNGHFVIIKNKKKIYLKLKVKT